MLCGLVMELIGYVWMIALVGQATSSELCMVSKSILSCRSYAGTPWVFWRFVVGAFFCIFGLPFLLVSGTSLYSKLLPKNMQGSSCEYCELIFVMCLVNKHVV